MTLASPPSPIPADWRPALPYVVVGLAWIVVGGLVGAVGSAAEWARAAWVAAYLVLVGGVSQLGLGAGRALLAAVPPSPTERTIELVAWNLGSLGVVAGDLAASLPVVVLGGLALIAALVWFAVGARRGGRRVRARWVSAAYDAGVLVLLVSVAIGVGLAPGPP